MLKKLKTATSHVHQTNTDADADKSLSLSENSVTLDDDKSSNINDRDDKVCDIKASDTEVVITHDNEGKDNVDDDTNNSDEELILELPSELVTSVSPQTLSVHDQQLLVTHKHSDTNTNAANQNQEPHAHKRQCTTDISQGDTNNAAASAGGSKKIKNEDGNSQALSSGNAVSMKTKVLTQVKAVLVGDQSGKHMKVESTTESQSSASSSHVDHDSKTAEKSVKNTAAKYRKRRWCTENKTDLEVSCAKKQGGPIQTRAIPLKRTRQSDDEDELGRCSAKKLKHEIGTKAANKKRGRESDDDEVNSGLTKRQKTLVMTRDKGQKRAREAGDDEVCTSFAKKHKDM